MIDAPARVRELAEEGQLPTTMTLMALGQCPKAHTVVAGYAGDARRAQHQLLYLQEADFLMVLECVLMTGQLAKPSRLLSECQNY
ncbi:hypothetical protein ACNKHL_22735 [Shigella flexneri]